MTALHQATAAGDSRRESESLAPLLSVCLIVKDEEEMLGACLESVASVANEIVVYDTGSSDRTIEIARAAGAKVLEGYWDNDFARARNVALENATGDWVLTLDADEIFQCDADALTALLRGASAEVEAYMVAVENLEGAGSLGMAHMSVRIARRTAAQWHYSLHEQLLPVDSPERDLRREYWSEARIVHRGYLAQVMKSKNKAQRNLTIAKAALDEDEANRPYATLNYGRSLVMAGHLEEAVDVLREAATYSTLGPFSRTVLTVLVALLTDLGRYDEALEEVLELRKISTNQIAADIAEGRTRIAKGETERGLAILARLPTRGRDDDALEHDIHLLTGVRSNGLASLGRYGEAADLVLDSVRAEGVIKADLGELVGWLVKEGRSPSEIARALSVDDLIPALGQMIHLNVAEADAVLEGVYESFPDRLETLAVASRIGPRLALERALVWSSRLRERGLASACPLVAIAGDANVDPRTRVLAAAVAFGTFDDRAVVRSVHEARALLDAQNLSESTEQIARLAPGLLEAEYVEPAALVSDDTRVAPIPTKFVRAARERTTLTTLRVPALRGGVNVVGSFSGTSIDAEIARTIARALVVSGFAVSTTDYNSDGRTGPVSWSHVDAGDQPYGTTILVIAPEELGNYAMDTGTATFESRYVIGVWRSEFDTATTLMGVTAQMLREIWTPGKFAADVVQRVTDREVLKMSLPLGAAQGSERVVGECAGTVFLASVDYAGGFLRQNPLDTVEAFCRAFECGEGPRLVIETAHASRYPLDHAALLHAVGARDDIEVIESDEGATGRFIYDWKPDNACFVSLHRSEGTGLALSRAMSSGIPSIVTAHSCGAELLGERDSFQVPFVMEKVPESESYFAASEYWAKPDVDQAATAMRLAAEDAALRRFKGRRSKERAQRLFSASSLRTMRERLSRIERLYYAKETSAKRDEVTLATTK
ncbi:MAG: glycosyltransferase [Acidimicrobiales bacterium]